MDILLIKKCLTIVVLCFIISIYAKCGDGIIRNSVGKEKRRWVKAFAASSVANLSGAENSNVCSALKGFEWSGDEFGNSQNGNNNAWCQDNSVGWTDWKCMKKQEKLFFFVKKAIAFRKDHPILHMPNELRSVDYMAKGFPDVSFHGERAWFLNMENTSRLIGIMYCGAYAQKPDGTDDDFLYIGYNFHWEKRNIALPNLPDGMTWKKIADTSDQEEKNWFCEGEETYKKTIDINPRTIVVLVARQGEIENASVAALQDDNKA